MQLTVKGKPLKGKEIIKIKNDVRLNVFDWQDGFYHLEVQIFDGSIWKREGSTQCIDEVEYKAIKNSYNPQRGQ